MGPRQPAAAIKAAEKALLYPAFSISGSMMAPMAAVVAMPEPDSAAKNAQEITATIARPPRTQPTRLEAKSTIRLEIPPASIRAPARIK